MPDSFIRWRRSSRKQPSSPKQPRAGIVPAERPAIQGDSAQNAVQASRRKIFGSANAAPKIRADSVLSAVSRSPQACPSINAINAAGSLRPPIIPLVSARNAAILSGMRISNNQKRIAIQQIRQTREVLRVCFCAQKIVTTRAIVV